VISTAYYALFHGLAEVAADRLVGSGRASQGSPAWARVYRDLNHQSAKKACSRPEVIDYSQELTLFTDYFPRLQELRHRADYDPVVRFKQAEAATAVNDAEKALISLQAAPKEEQLDFATLALAMTRN
jgi:transposase